MWSSRIQQLVKEFPGHFDNLIDEDNLDNIFQTLKSKLIDSQFTKQITLIFSPIILHLVSDIVVESISTMNDDMNIVNLLSFLIPSFSSIEPLIHFYFTFRPVETSKNLTEFFYIRSIFRIRRIIGNSFELKLSRFMALADTFQISEETWFYVASLISILKNLSEDKTLSLISSRCSSEVSTRLFLEENEFDEQTKNIEFPNFGPLNYSRGFATSIGGVPFLRSLKSLSDYSSTFSAPTSPFARSLALAMLTNKPVLVVGEPGSGKTTLIEQLAQIADAEIVSLHLGSAVDAKSLLGGYICGEIPGEFRWLDGPLTSAVRANKKWIVLEQIEEASSEVLTLLAPLLSERRLFVPGRSETIKAGYNIRIFATCVKPLDSSLWTKIQVDFLEKDDLRKTLLSSYPSIEHLLDKILLSWSECHLSYHELFRCARRLSVIPIINASVSHETYVSMYQIVVDTFTSHLPKIEKRLELAKIIAKHWDLSETEAESYLITTKPIFIPNPFRIGNIELEAIGNPVIDDNFAPTFTSLHHMESVARAIFQSEPVLFIGETGTGKTTLIQFLASAIGAELKVINMHHQSDALDILGGFKPVDLLELLKPLSQRFYKAFEQTFSQKKNANLLDKIGQYFGMKEWKKFLKCVLDVSNKSINNKEGLSDELRAEWIYLRDSSTGFLSRTDFLERDFAFSFVEGPLASAYRNGQWVLLDEVNLAPPETLLALAPIIDGNLELPNGELVKKHPNFRIICCMNPATDVGKVNLPETLKHKFVSIFADETSSENDISLILSQRKVNFDFHKVIYNFYSTAREMSKTVLVDGGGQRIIFSLRALTRAILYMNKAEPIFGPFRACYDALMLSFVSPLSPESSERLISQLNSMITPYGFPDFNTKKKQTKSNNNEFISVLKPPDSNEFIEVEGFYIKKGPFPIKTREDFILTQTARSYLRLLAQAVFLGKSPVLLQGPTSSGKTTIVQYLADITGHKFVRINNHEHTDMSEYIGGYSTTETGKFEFVEGALVKAIKIGAWVVLDELNLAPSDVLEALNRLLDDNNQLYVAETQTTYYPEPSFRLFATQNPPGTYGGRKQLSRAFRGRFIEIHVDEIPPKELTTIITERTHIAKNFAESMVKVFNSLRRHRQFSQIFAGKQAFLTVRDLLRWAFRGPDTWISVANEGFALLGERLRSAEERSIVKDTIKKEVKIKNEEIQIENEFSVQDVSEDLSIVWTSGMVRTVNLLLKCIKNKEPALLVGETGTGKTTAVQVVANLLGRNLRILNCHQHTETSDFIGAMRPSRSNEGKLFEWADGSLVEAMRNGEIFLMDEISLAQDSALERLNSVLEPGRTLAIAEKPEYEIIEANENFVFIATMNPGGDYGKRELSASLRNRFTEIWVPSIDSDEDLLEILASNSSQEETKSNLNLFLQFVRYFTSLSKNLVNISLRDVLQWIRFVDLRVRTGHSFLDSYIQGAFMVFIDCVSPPQRKDLIAFLQGQLKQSSISEFSHEFHTINDTLFIGDFELPKGPDYNPEINEANDNNFIFDAPTTSQNLLRVGRALQMPFSVLIEGPPGVGKTSLVMSLGKRLGFNVVRINLSEHTEMLDLVGSELPVENADGGSFAWRDGAFLTALKNGYWVILDELNLASQSVLEGLNSCLDHRATLYVPELNMEFKCHPQFRIFGCQNPASAGHGRKSLPRSFLNRFTRVYVDELSGEDFEYIIANSYTSIPLELRKTMINFVSKLNELRLDFEFNLRDVFRLCEMINAKISPEKALTLLFVQRIRDPSIRNKVLNMLFDLFGAFNPKPNPFLISKNTFRIGDLQIDRSSSTYSPSQLIIHPAIVSPLEAVLSCAYMKWPGLIVGSTATGKSSLIRLAAHISGRKLVEFSMNNSVDTTELLGGFEQMDNHRCFEQLRAKIQPNDYESLAQLESLETPEELYYLIMSNKDSFSESIIKEAEDLMKRKADPGRFEWVDGLLLQAMRNGWWIIIDNANLCPPAVLDRLNPLCEPGGYLSLNERGHVEDDIEIVYPHENFRLFMTVDPHYGEISRAMRNRSIEIYLPSYLERTQQDLSDTNILREECKDLCGVHGEEFYELMKTCERHELRQLSAWNLMAYKNFRDQTSVAQLGTDAILFDIVNCQLTNKQNKMTRSNSSVLQLHQSCSEENMKNEFIPISSPFKFVPMTDSSILTVLYDSNYLFQKGPNNASIQFYLGSSRASDFNARLIVAQNWPKVLDSIRELETSDLLQFVEDLQLDPLLWAKPQKTLSFTAHYLLLTLNLKPTEINDIESFDLRLSLSSLIPQFFSDLIDQIKFAIQTNSINYQILLILKSIDLFNQREKDSLPLFRFLRSLLKHSGLSVNISSITNLICPNNSIEASKYRKNLGEPFSFKFEKPYILWQRINEHWRRIFNESSTSFMAQSPQITTMLETIILSQTEATNSVEKLFNQLSNIELSKDASIEFVDRIEDEDFQYREEYRIVNLSTSYPFELLQDLSIRAFIYSIVMNVSDNKEISIPPDFMIPLDIVALVKSYNQTHNLSDLLSALCELILNVNKEIAYAPSINTIMSILQRKATLLQSEHNKNLHIDTFNLLKSIPKIDLKSMKLAFANVFNLEADKLQIDKIDPGHFKESLFKFSNDKWNKIASLSEVDDSYYHMVICQMAQIIIGNLNTDENVMKEIMFSRIGNDDCQSIKCYEEEKSLVQKIHDKSIKKSKFRGTSTNQFSKLKSIINRITISETTDFAKSLDESGTALLLNFPLYRDISIPIVTVMRQLSLAIDYNEPHPDQIMSFPFTVDSLLSFLFSLSINTNNGSVTNWALTFSLIGRSSMVHPPLTGFQIPKTNAEFHTQQEEEKVAQQIEELFTKKKKSELCVYAKHFVNSILNPDELKPEKLLKMVFKQFKKLDFQAPYPLDEDIKILPLLLYIMTRRYNSSSINSNSKPINIYQKSSIEDISELLRIVRSVLKTVDSLWERYPNHDTLRQIAKSADLILGQEIDAPLINFLDSLETMMGAIREWQHKDRDFADILYPMVKLANKLLAMRLESWKQIFESRRESLQENIGQDFYMLFCELSTCTPETIPDFFFKITSYIETSPIGLLDFNLRMVEAFALYSLRFEDKKDVYPLLMNTVYKYRGYLPQVENHIKSLLVEPQKKMNEYVKLQKWDIDSDKKHFIRIDKVKVQLNKYCQQHLAILQLQFKQLIEQFSSQIAHKTEGQFSDASTNDELNDKILELLDNEKPLRNRVFEARRYIITDMEITYSNNEMRSNFAKSPIFVFWNEPLYGKQFEKHNALYGEALLLLEQISSLYHQPHDDLREESQDIFGISENLIIYAIEKRRFLHNKPFVQRDDIKFQIRQIVLILRSFVELEPNEIISASIDKIDSYTKLQQVPIEDVINELKLIKNPIPEREDNYVYNSINVFIDNSIEILTKIKNPVPPPRNPNSDSKEEVSKHLTLMRFIVAVFKIFCIALKDGYGEKNDEENDDQPQEVEGHDGIGLGEGVGNEDITNEIEDEDQLIGDNVNTNEDQQDENDVEKEGGFEVEPEFDGAADVKATEEEEQMDDEMGDAETDDAMDSRTADDDSKEAEKETELDQQQLKDSKEEQEMQKDNDADEGEEEDKNEEQNQDDKDKPNDDNKEIDLDEPEEDNFESDAAQWNEDPEEIKMDADEDRMLNGQPENEEEEENVDEEGINIEEDGFEEMPPDIEDEPDELLGKVAPDKSNPEGEEDKNEETKDVKGEGKREEVGDGEDGEGKDQDDNENSRTTQENEEEEEKEEDELKRIEKELKIVQRKILKGENLKEGGDGGERDDDADEGIILPADEAEDHEKLEEAKDETDETDNEKVEENKDGNQIDTDFANDKSLTEHEEDEEDTGITHIKFEPSDINSNNNEFVFQKKAVVQSVRKTSISDEGRSKWESILAKTREGASDLCEQLRLVLEATVAAKMRGDFRTGKRLNMRKIIPFIASGFRKDKIWMRRIQPDQRNYQIFLAVDNSGSMKDNTGEMALESISLITQALMLLGIGELCVAKFGDSTEIVHPFGEQWNDESGANLVDSFKFDEEHTYYDELLHSAISYLDDVKKSGAMQLCFIISDAAQLNRKEDIKKFVIQAQLRNLLVVFVLIDSQDFEKRRSVLETFSFQNGKLSHFLDEFPFPFYVLINDPKKLPERLADALRQWFELANNNA